MSLYEPYMHFGSMSPPIDPARCRVQTYDDISRYFNQCARKKVIEHDGIGYCKQHSPAESAKRAAASKDKHDRQSAILRRTYDRPHDYRGALREIAAGHNDPRTLAKAVLEKWNDAAPVDTRPKGEDSLLASFTGSAVGKAEAPNLSPSNHIPMTGEG